MDEGDSDGDAEGLLLGESDGSDVGSLVVGYSDGCAVVGCVDGSVVG